ncbi:MAG: SpoIIE family protein phosphatase [Bacteroidota bacterium]|nr:SpoIIE family protein phosphatase [Bacteroidota bacterium]
MTVHFQASKILLFVLVFFISSLTKGDIPDNVEENEQLLSLAIKNKDYVKASFYSYELAKLYWEDKSAEKAVEYFSQCLTYSRKSNNIMLSFQASQYLGQIFTEKKSHSKALENFQKSLKFSIELKRPDFTNEALVQIAISYANMSKHKKAIEPLEEALSLAVQQENLLMQQKCYALLADYFQILGNTNKAKEFKNLYANLVKSKQNEEQTGEQLKILEQQVNHVSIEKNVVNSKLSQQVKKLRKAEDSLVATKYSLEETEISLKATESNLQEVIQINEHRQLQIDLLNKDKELAEMKIMDQNARLEYEAWIRNLIVAAIFLSIAFVVVVVISYRKKEDANKKIEQQNKNIKSSINYAKRIQEAMLPNPDQQKSLIPNSFVLLKPRDSVSGDFYWITELKSWNDPDVIFAAADCTGHGVPGAFMSMVGINSLNGIINRGIADTNEILDSLDVEIRSSLQQETTKNNDGMDIAICIFRSEKNILEFSGAKNPLVYIKNNELHQIKGDVQSIGGNNIKKNVPFKKYSVIIEEPTMIYLFSDGYRDQFGKDNNGKFMSKKFHELLLEIHQKPMQEQKEILDNTIEDWKGDGNQTDDILVMGILIEPAV